MKKIINFDSKRERRQLYEYLKGLKSVHEVKITKARKYDGRYKYYFGHVIPAIQYKEVYFDMDGNLIEDYNEIHAALKMEFNPQRVINSKMNKITISGKSTTVLSDYDFINDYEEQIIAKFSQEPWYIEFIPRHEWTQQRIDWHERKIEGLVDTDPNQVEIPVE